MPATCMYATRCHSLHIVVHATLNLLATSTMAPLSKQPSMNFTLRMEIASNL